MTMNWNRILSGLIAVIYIVAGFMKGGAEFGWAVIPVVILPLAFIWFGDGMDNYIGGMPRQDSSPNWVAPFGGWVWLLLPVIIWIVNALIILL